VVLNFDSEEQHTPNVSDTDCTHDSCEYSNDTASANKA
jgi:hypothetical protein